MEVDVGVQGLVEKRVILKEMEHNVMQGRGIMGIKEIKKKGINEPGKVGQER